MMIVNLSTTSLTPSRPRSKIVWPAIAGLAAFTAAFMMPSASAGTLECPGVSDKATKAMLDEDYFNLAFFSLDRIVRGKAAPAERAAAIACIDRVQEKSGIVDLPNYDASLAALAPRHREAIARFAFRSILQRTATTSAKKLHSVNRKALAVVKGTKYDSAARGWIAAVSGSSSTSARKILADAKESLKGESASIQASVGLAAARAEYAAGNDAAAIAEYQKLFKIGAPMQDALIESAWAQLRTKNYAKAIGLSYELTTGKLSQFFAPEALTVRSIGFVENCRYAAARSAMEMFSETYVDLANWLKKKAPASLYEVALARAEDAVGEETVPALVWSVWSSSDLFVALQKGIQQSFTEEREAAEWLADGEIEGSAATYAKKDLAKLAKIRARAAGRIESHLSDLNASMAARIKREAERMRFVRVEANQGAGRDLVFRNANPEVAKLEKKLIKKDRKAKSYRGKLAWGDAREEDPRAELWIDEIGNFEAKSLDKCKTKTEYKKMQASR